METKKEALAKDHQRKMVSLQKELRKVCKAFKNLKIEETR